MTDDDESPTQVRGGEDTMLASQPGPRDSAPAISPEKYGIEKMLGRGGMGEVLLAQDKKLGRNVAIKRMRADEPTPDQVARFVREAHIQARLDHPAVVPVHELAEDADGRPFFTMKRLVGTTLYDLLKDGGASLQKLLRAFVDVCLAIEYAHAKHIVHRDLKPSNVMLGNYGEVYVLDWGVARALGDTELGGVAIDSYESSSETQQGAVLGTPGYMSPEQMRGESVDCATDVYALGAILWEILVGEPLHPRGAVMTSTLSGHVFVPTRRAPDRAIPPELDAVCAKALVEKPTERGTAQSLADAVQRYLDGDRDIERRHTLAAESLEAAHAAVRSGDRPEAMRRAGRALALHPESREAASLVTTLMLKPPDPPPPGLAKRFEEIDLEDTVRQAKFATLAMVAYLCFLPVVALIGVHDWRIFIAAYAIVVLLMGGSVYMARKRIPRIWWAVLANTILIVMLSRAFSPLLVVPSIAVASTTALSSFPKLRAHWVWGSVAFAVLFPTVLEAAGVLEPMVTYTSSSVAIAPSALAFGPTSTPILLAAVHVTVIVVVGLVVHTLGKARRDAQRKVEGQAWMLERLLPEA